MSTPSDPRPPELHYAPPPRLAWVGRHRRALITVALLVAVGVPGYHYRQTIFDTIRWHYWFRQCLAHQMPADAPLWVSDPQEAAAVLATDSDYTAYALHPGGRTTPVPTTRPAVYVPRAFRELRDLDGRCRWLDRARFATSPIIFLGARSRPDGQTRLVVIDSAGENGYLLLHHTNVMVLPPPRLFDRPERLGFSPGHASAGFFIPASLRAAQPDPNDPTHLTIAFDVYSVHGMFGLPGEKRRTAEGIIDAYLQNDDSLRVTIREGSVVGEVAKDIRLGPTTLPGRPSKEMIDGMKGFFPSGW